MNWLIYLGACITGFVIGCYTAIRVYESGKLKQAGVIGSLQAKNAYQSRFPGRILDFNADWNRPTIADREKALYEHFKYRESRLAAAAAYRRETEMRHNEGDHTLCSLVDCKKAGQVDTVAFNDPNDAA